MRKERRVNMDEVEALVASMRAGDLALLENVRFHLDEEAGRMTVTAVHPDSASLELHMEVGREEFRKLGDMITLRRIEVYGSISERAREMLEQKATMLGGSGVTVVERFAGFARTPPARD